jgi:hypothetical protein
LYGNVEAKVLQTVNKFVGLLMLVALVKVVRPRIFVKGPVFEHVISGSQDGSATAQMAF